MSELVRLARFAPVSIALVSVLTTAGCWSSTDTPEVAAPLQPLRTVPAPERENTWPGFRGGVVQGVSIDQGFPLRWNGSDGVRWRVPLAGPANSSSIVWEDRIFAVVAGANDEVQLGCIERATGAIAWTQSLGKAGGPTRLKQGHPAATPCTDGERVYVSSAAGMWCFAFDGQRLWHTPVVWPAHPWGQGSSPIVCGDLVLQLADGESGSFLAAFKTSSGREVWRAARASNGCWSTPSVVSVMRDGRPSAEVIVNGSGTSDASEGFVTSYDPASGNVLWQLRGTSDIPCPSAIVGGGLIVSSSGSNGPIFAMRAGEMPAGTAERELWRLPSGGPYAPTGVIINEALYILTDRGQLTCRDLRSGRELWSARLRGNYSASLVAGDGHLYATNEQGETTIVDASPVEYRQLAVNEVNERCLATPALAGGQLFLRTESALYCIEGVASPSAGTMTPESDAAHGASSNGEMPTPELRYKPEISPESSSSPSDTLPRYEQ